MNKTQGIHPYISFLDSTKDSSRSVHTSAFVNEWIEEQKKRIKVDLEITKFSKLNQWTYDANKGSVCHTTGKFFSIDGISVKTNWGNIHHWEQPIINQPEVGYLGFLVKEINGVLHFLVQAKIEPGNINVVQLSPTLQATRSNFQQVHKGKKPNYLDYFVSATPEQVLVDQLQSEQGGRFLKKRNRNIIVKVEEEIACLPQFIWLTLAQIKKLMAQDNVVNMDTRTVISCIPFGGISDQDLIEKINQNHATNNYPFLASALNNSDAKHRVEELISWMTHLKSNYDLDIKSVSLKKLDNWSFSDEAIFHEKNKYFRVIPVKISIENREVAQWDQPMVQPAQEGLCAFVVKKINGILHFAVQAKLECGNHDIIELAPTVQCLTGNYKNSIHKLPFLEYVLHAKKEQKLIDNYQSEEGGRFYKEQNKNLLIIAGDEISEDLPKNYKWMTLHQLYTFLKFNNYLNIQSRSLIASIPFDYEG